MQRVIEKDCGQQCRVSQGSLAAHRVIVRRASRGLRDMLRAPISWTHEKRSTGEFLTKRGDRLYQCDCNIQGCPAPQRSDPPCALGRKRGGTKGIRGGRKGAGSSEGATGGCYSAREALPAWS